MPNTIKNPDDVLFSRSNSNPGGFGKNWEQWSMDWWNWLMAIPKATSPANDADGTNYNNSQTPPVFFLAGTFVPFPFRQSKDSAVRGSSTNPLIIAPVGGQGNYQAIFFPFSADLETEIEKPAQLANLNKVATDDIDRLMTLELSIDDGIDSPGIQRVGSISLTTGYLSQFRVRTQDDRGTSNRQSQPIFDVNISPQDLFDLNPNNKPITTSAGADGFYAFINIDHATDPNALSPGLHKIYFKAVEDDFLTEVTYYIKI
jgi:hypothetical protein